MRRIFQSEWHGIPFKDFTVISSKSLADPEFYRHFYKYFLTKYHNWSELDPSWLEIKMQTAKFLESRFSKKTDAKILSIGCGLGVIEKVLIDDGYNNLDITEGSEEPLVWIRRYIPQKNIFVGVFPECVPLGHNYDVIYLVAAEYFLNQEELVFLLKKAKAILSTGGKCILISVSFESPGIVNNTILLSKCLIKYLLVFTHIKDRGQFWGYSRNRKDFYNAMRSAGFSNIEDGLLKKEAGRAVYWIDAKI